MIRVYEPTTGPNQRNYILDCVDTNSYTFHGKYIQLFEEALSRFIGVKHVITTFNGSVSLYMMYKAYGLEGRFVVAPTMTYAATISQLCLVGAKPYLIDCDDHFQMDLNILEDVAKTFYPYAVICPQLYADAPQMNDLVKIADKYNMLLLEDSAEAFGCRDENLKHIGTFGEAASFSFFANKIITSGGEGGCVVTNNDKVANWMRNFKNQNNIGGYRHSGPASNFRMTNIQAACGLSQLEIINQILFRKQAIAHFYREKLPELSPLVPKIYYSSEWLNILKIPENHTYETLNLYCSVKGIETRPIFTPIHLMNFPISSYPQLFNMAEKAYKEYFIVPSGPDLSNDELYYIVDCLKNIPK